MKAITINFEATKNKLGVLAATAAGPKENKGCMSFIYHDEANKKLVATNGRVLAVLDVPAELEASEELKGVKYLTYSKGILLEAVCNDSYVYYRGCIPAGDCIPFPEPYKKEWAKGKAQGVYNMSVLCAGCGVTYDFKYSKSLEFSIDEWRPCETSRRPCMVKGEGLTVVIMAYGGDLYKETQQQLQKLKEEQERAKAC